MSDNSSPRTSQVKGNYIPASSNLPEHQPEKRAGTEEYTTIIISNILRWGVIISTLIMLIGLLLIPTRPGGLSVQRIQHFPSTLNDVWTGLWLLRPQAIIALGLLLLIATPIVRVATSIVAFWIERDYRYVIITFIVLLILCISLFIGKAGS